MSTNPKIYYCNPAGYTLTASGGSATGHPVTKMQDFIRNEYWVSGGSGAQYITAEFPVASGCDYAIIEAGDAFEVGWTSLTIEAADNAGMTVNRIGIYAGSMPASGTSLFEFAGTVTKAYWRFTLGGTLTEAPNVSLLFLGMKLEFTFPHDFGGKIGDSSFISTVGRSLSGIKRTSQAVGGTRLIEVQFSLISDAAATQYRTFHDTVRGQLRPFYYSPDGGTTLYYVSLAKDYNPITQYRPGQNNTQTIVMETADSEVV